LEYCAIGTSFEFPPWRFDRAEIVIDVERDLRVSRSARGGRAHGQFLGRLADILKRLQEFPPYDVR